MISKEEAEKIIEKPISQPPISNFNSTSFYDWLEDVSILNFPEIASKILTEEALFVVHPGAGCFYSLEYLTSGNLTHDYIKYINRVKSEILSTLGKKTVLIWTEIGYKTNTLRFLGLGKDSVILIPTEDSYSILMKDIVRMEEKQFYEELSKYVKSAKLLGEQSSGCLKGVERCCNGLIITQKMDSLVYF
jgi:hypothetical protein